MNIREIESQMRDATEEELKGVNDYIESISTPTGVNFYDLIDDCLKSPRDPNIDLPKAYDYNKSYK